MQVMQELDGLSIQLFNVHYPLFIVNYLMRAASYE